MFRFSVFLPVLFAFFLHSSYASAQVYLSEYARQGMENFERDRPEMCFGFAHHITQVRFFRDKDPAFTPDEGADYVSDLERLSGAEVGYNFMCEIEAITFLKPEVEKVCVDEMAPENFFCETFQSYKFEGRSEGVKFYEEDLESFAFIKNSSGWTVVENYSVPGGFNGMAISKMGNVYVALALTLNEMDKNDPRLAGFKPETLFTFYSTDPTKANKVYLPVFSVLGMTQGLTDGFYDSSLKAFYSDSGNPVIKDFGPKLHLNWQEVYNFETPLTSEIMEILLNSEKISLQGQYPKDEGGDLIFTIDVENSGFGKVYSELLPYFTEYVNTQGLNP